MTTRWNKMQPGELSSGFDRLFNQLDKAVAQLQTARGMVHDVNTNGIAAARVAASAPRDALVASSAPASTTRSLPQKAPVARPPMPPAPRKKTAPQGEKATESVQATPRQKLEGDIREMGVLGDIEVSSDARRHFTDAYDTLMKAAADCVEAQKAAHGVPMTDDLAKSLVAIHARMLGAYTSFFTLEAPFASEKRQRLLELAPQAIDHLVMLFSKARRTTSVDQHIKMLESLLKASSGKLEVLKNVNPTHLSFWLGTQGLFDLTYDTLEVNCEMARQMTLCSGTPRDALRSSFEDLMDVDEDCIEWEAHFKITASHDDGCTRKILMQNENFHFNVLRFFTIAAQIPALESASSRMAHRSLRRVVSLLDALKLRRAAQRQAASPQIKKSLTFIDNVYAELASTCPAYAAVWQEARQALDANTRTS